MFDKIFSSWNWIRFIRLAFGVYIVVQSVLTKEWIFVGLGGLLTLMPLLNIGCGSGGCGIPTPKNSNHTEEVSFEEIKNK